jgi:hypothetical protein
MDHPYFVGMPPHFINSLQKRVKKTNFFVDPNLVSRLRGILGWGRRPHFGKSLEIG